MVTKYMRIPTFIGLSISPWVVAFLLFAPGAALSFLLLFLLSAGLGYLALLVGFPALSAENRLPLAIPVGFIIFSGAEGLLVRYAGARGLGFAVCCILGVAGFVALLRLLLQTQHLRVHHGGALVALSFAVCVVYFLPSLLVDASTDAGGAFRWLYVDNQFHMAVAASIKEGTLPPRAAGCALKPLTYHFGSHALAAAVARFFGVELADAIARVVRAVGQVSLICSTAALGEVLGRTLTRAGNGAWAAVAGLFFVGSPTALFAAQHSSSGPPIPATIFELPLATTGYPPFAHFILGLSLLWGTIGILTVFCMILAVPEIAWHDWRPVVFLGALCLFVFSLNAVAGIAVGGSALAFVVWNLSPIPMRRFLLPGGLVLFAGALFPLAFLLGKYSTTFSFDINLSGEWFRLSLWAFLALGVRLAAISWLSSWRREAASFLLFVSILGLGGLTLFIADSHWNNDGYGIRFLEPIITVYGAVALVAAAGRHRARPQVLAGSDDVVSLVIRGGQGLFAALAGVSLLVLLWDFFAREEVAERTFAVIGVSLLAVVVLALFARLISARYGIRVAARGALLLILTMQLGAPLVTYRQFLIGTPQLVRVAGPEVRALRTLRDKTDSDVLVATNQHSFQNIRRKPERSYAYRALSERPFLLEGWQYGEKYIPDFSRLLGENEEIFSTEDPTRLREILDRYGVTHIMPKPGTGLSMSVSEIPWLKIFWDSEGIVVYEVQR